MASLDDLRDDDLAWDVVLRERTRLADALHDGALQELMALRHDCTEATAGDREALDALQDGLRRLSSELRALTGAMHEPSLNELTLSDAIGRIVQALPTRGRLEIVVDVDPKSDGYNDPVVRETVRELTMNVTQHANATIVAVSVALADDELRVRVVDDGVGFDVAKAALARAAGHIGLGRIERLAGRLDGTFSMSPAVPTGTTATVVLPLGALKHHGDAAPELPRPQPTLDRDRPATLAMMLAAEKRDGIATNEDLVAAARDLAATRRDHPAEWRASVRAGGDRHGLRAIAADYLRPRQGISGALADRQHAAADRERGASQRLLAAADRTAFAAQLVHAETDWLTGVRTRSAGLADLDREIDRSQRSTGVLTLAYLDIVGLKAINDQDGHAAGDRLIQRVITTVRERLRPYDLVIRMGGDEFVCVMPDLPRRTAEQRFAGIVMGLGRPPGARIRTGYAGLRPKDTSQTLIARADHELTRHRRRSSRQAG